MAFLDASCRLAAGSTRFCAGILSTARHLTIEQKMADYSNKLYHQLEQETGIQTGKQVTRRPPVSLRRRLRGSGAPGRLRPAPRRPTGSVVRTRVPGRRCRSPGSFPGASLSACCAVSRFPARRWRGSVLTPDPFQSLSSSGWERLPGPFAVTSLTEV